MAIGKLHSAARVALLLCVLIPLAGCDMFGFRDWSWHQKLTVSVMTPDGLKTGSATTAVWIEATPSWWGVGAGGAMNSSLRGEAVVIDLGGERFLFGIFNGSYDIWAGYRSIFPEPKLPTKGDIRFEQFDQMETLHVTKELPREKYPLFVTFEDIHNPASVKRVDPDHLEVAFGPGFHLSAVTIAITDEPVTKGRVEDVLPWLRSVWPNQLDGQRYQDIRAPNRFANSIGTGSFSTEIRR